MTVRIQRRGLMLGAAALVVAPAVPMAAGAPGTPAHAAALSAFERQVLLTYRSLSPRRQEAWLRMMHRLVAGMAPREAGYRMYRELGDTAREARDRIDAALAGFGAKSGEPV